MGKIIENSRKQQKTMKLMQIPGNPGMVKSSLNSKKILENHGNSKGILRNPEKSQKIEKRLKSQTILKTVEFRESDEFKESKKSEKP